MKKLLLVLLLVAVAVCGCMEKTPSGTKESVGDLKTLAINSAENLSSYSLQSTATQVMKLYAAGINVTPEKQRPSRRALRQSPP